MSIRQFSGDYIAMANSTLQLAGWDEFFPSGQLSFSNSTVEKPEAHFYEGDWVGIRAVEDTWLFVDGPADNHNFNNVSIETLRDTNGWDSDQAKIMISSGDIVYGRFTKVKIIEGHALGIRTSKAESPEYNVKPTNGYYNPEDFPGCIGRYDFGGLVNNTDNEYGTVDGSGNIEKVKNLSTYRNPDNIALPDIVDLNDRKGTLTVNKPDIDTSTLTGKTVAHFDQSNRECMTMDYPADADAKGVRLSMRGSPLTFVTVMKTASLMTFVSSADWGHHLISSDYGTGSAQSGNFIIGQYASSGFNRRYGMSTDETSTTYLTPSNINTSDFVVNIFQVWDQDDNLGKFYTGRCTIFEDDPDTADADIHNGSIFTHDRTNDHIIGLMLGFSREILNFATSNSATYTGADVEEYFNGHIGELLIYNKPLCLFERTEIINYLNNKWGI